MSDVRTPSAEVVQVRLREPPGTNRRRARRRPLAGVLVVIEAPRISSTHWVADAFDISAEGMGLVLPPALPLAEDVLLSFRLDPAHEFSRVPATVRHLDGLAGGGVSFGGWSESDRFRLLEHLATH
jgi:hypothetical protein